MVKFITMDIGNSICKTNMAVEFNSQILETNISTIEFSEAIIIEEKCYAIGQGEYENKDVKIDKASLIKFLLYGIACSTTENNVNLLLNLPINQLPLKEDLVKMLKDKSFTFIVNSNIHGVKLTERTVKIGKVAIIGEAISSYYTLSSELKDFIVMLDIGSKTINYATYTEIGRMDILKSGTLDFGIHYFYNMLIEHYKNVKRITYSISDIDKRIRASKIAVPQALKEEFVDKIKNAIKGEGFVDYQDYSIKCIGGGSLVLKDVLEKEFSDLVVLEDAISRNVNGLEVIGNTLKF